MHREREQACTDCCRSVTSSVQARTELIIRTKKDDNNKKNALCVWVCARGWCHHWQPLITGTRGTEWERWIDSEIQDEKLCHSEMDASSVMQWLGTQAHQCGTTIKPKWELSYRSITSDSILDSHLACQSLNEPTEIWRDMTLIPRSTCMPFRNKTKRVQKVSFLLLACHLL